VTAVAGTLCVLHLGLVWGSYTAKAWAETHVRVMVAWQAAYLPFLDDMTNQVVRTTSLASFLQDLDGCHAYTLLVLLWFTALVLPCLCMVIAPTLVVGDYIHPFSSQKRRIHWDGRTFVELATRFAWLSVYSLSLVSLATSFVELEWTGTQIYAGQQAKAPMAAYVVGTTCAVGLLALLRAPRTESLKIVSALEHEIEFSPLTPPPVRSPPPQAFQHPWQLEESFNNEEEPLMTVLEHDALAPSSPPRPPRTFPTLRSPPQTPVADDATPDLIDEEERPPLAPRLTWWNKFVAFQVGLVSVILWIPSFYLPMLHFSYSGMVADLLQQPSLRLYLWEVPGVLWDEGRQFETPLWILLLVGLFSIATVLVLPLLATFMGVLAWLGEGAWADKSYVWLYTLHPSLGGVVFALAMLTTMSVLQPLSSLLFDEQTFDACHGVTGSPCLVVRGQLLSGAFFYLVQAIFLEIFVLCTLQWSRRR
jgi:hypothetical protein